jgi:hypothetical protein
LVCKSIERTYSVRRSPQHTDCSAFSSRIEL